MKFLFLFSLFSTAAFLKGPFISSSTKKAYYLMKYKDNESKAIQHQTT